MSILNYAKFKSSSGIRNILSTFRLHGISLLIGKFFMLAVGYSWYQVLDQTYSPISFLVSLFILSSNVLTYKACLMAVKVLKN